MCASTLLTITAEGNVILPVPRTAPPSRSHADRNGAAKTPRSSRRGPDGQRLAFPPIHRNTWTRRASRVFENAARASAERNV